MEDKMVKQVKMIGVILGFLMVLFGQTLGAASLAKPSGQLVNGFRVLSVNGSGESPEWTVFRGDYIKFNIGDLKDPVLSILSLSIEESLVSDLAQAPYFKMEENRKV